MAVLNATPLIALDAIVHRYGDHRARSAQGADRGNGCRADHGGLIDIKERCGGWLIGRTVPLEASRIMGSTMSLEGCFGLRDRSGRNFSELFAETVLIGHTIGFDLAMLMERMLAARGFGVDAAAHARHALVG